MLSLLTILVILALYADYIGQASYLTKVLSGIILLFCFMLPYNQHNQATSKKIGSNEDILDQPRLYTCYKIDYSMIKKQLIPYMINVIGLPAKLVHKFIAHVGSRKRSDRVILAWILDRIPNISELRRREQAYYDKRVVRTADKVAGIVKKFGIQLESSSCYLDIGTESEHYLDRMEDLLGISCSYGINIASGEIGSLGYTRQAGSKIIEYDGVNIPVIDGIHQYSLITSISTFHHVKNLDDLLVSIRTRCSGYLLIKENDLSDSCTTTYYLWQHYLFNNITNPEGENFMRIDLSWAVLKQKIEDVGFTYIDKIDTGSFTGAYYALFKVI